MSYIFQVIATDIDGNESVIVECWEGSDESDRWKSAVDLLNEFDILRYRTVYSLEEFKK